MHRTIVNLETGEVSIVSLTSEEIAEASKPEPVEQVRLRRVEELKQLLATSDYKVLPDYTRVNDDIIKQRSAWRDEIRSLLSSPL